MRGWCERAGVGGTRVSVRVRVSGFFSIHKLFSSLLVCVCVRVRVYTYICTLLFSSLCTLVCVASEGAQKGVVGPAARLLVRLFYSEARSVLR
jgi:hypothetical protein